MTQETHNKKIDKVKRVLSLIIAIILSLSLLGNLGNVIKNIVVVVKSFTGQTDTFLPGRAIGYLFGFGLLVYWIIRLFKYSLKKPATSVDQLIENTNK